MENKDLRKKQNARRREAGERPTLESMLRDLQEEADHPETDPEQKRVIEELLKIEKETR